MSERPDAEQVAASAAEYASDLRNLASAIPGFTEHPFFEGCATIIDLLAGRVADLEAALEEEVANRDRAEEWCDQLAYAIAPEADIGEHSSLNNPWANALVIARRAART